MYSAKLTVKRFIEKLCQRARYDVQGEKSIAVIAAIKYVNEEKTVGMPLSKIFSTYKQNVKTEFLDLANQYGRLKNPSGAFGVIVGKNGELLKAIEKDLEVDKAFSELTIDDIKQLYEEYIAKLKGSYIEEPQKREKAPFALVEPILETEVVGEFYLLIRDFESSIRKFIVEKLGKGWIKRLENDAPEIVKKWKARQEADDKVGIDPEEELINYADIADYIQITRKYSRVFFESDDDLIDVISHIRDFANIGRNPVVHCRTFTVEGYYTSKRAIKLLLKWMERRKNTHRELIS